MEAAARHERILSIDIARALCIVLVVAGHYFPDGGPVWYTDLRNWIYSFHMPLFMFLSGYVYSYTRREESYARFLGRKAKRLLLPYVIVSAVIISIKIASQQLLGMDIKNPVGFDSYLKMFLGPEAAVHLWFILALWWIFVVVALFRSRLAHIVLLLLAVVLHYLPSIAPGICYPQVFCLNYSAMYLIYFMLGVVLCDSGLDLHRPAAWLCALLTALFIANSLLHLCPPADAYVGIAGVLAFSALLQRVPSGWLAPVMAVGDASYTIYLVHSIFMGFIVTGLKFCPALLDTGGPLFGLGAVIIITLSVVLSVIVHRILNVIEKRRR